MTIAMKGPVLGLAGLLLATTGAFAEDRPDGRALFRQMDTNQDRRLQFTELQAMRGQIFDRLDANRNGVLEPEERDAALAARPDGGQGIALTMAEAGPAGRGPDLDGDGRITRAEFVAHLPERLRLADGNGDGALSMLELRALRRN